MASGEWNPTVYRGAVWRRTLRYRDAEGTPVAISGPGYMDVRTRPDENAALIARLDSSGTEDGSVTFLSEPGAVRLELRDEVTAGLPVGQYYYDLFVTDSTGEHLRLVSGRLTVAKRVSKP